MKENELAKLLLANDVPTEYIWIWELSNNGYVDTIEKENELYSKATELGLELRVLHTDTMITMDLQFNRLNINLDLNNKITGVDRG